MPPPDIEGFGGRGGGLLVLMVIGFVALVASAVLAVVLLRGSSDDELPTDVAAERLHDLIDATLEDPGDGELRTCPIERTDDLIDDLVDRIDDRRLDPLSGADAEDTAAAIAYPDSGVDVVVCDRYVADDNLSLFGVSAAPAPRRLDGYIAELTGEGVRPGTGEPVEGDEHRGGRFSTLCVQYDDLVDAFCEVYWVDDELLLSIYIAGASSIRIDLDDVETVLRDSLDDWVDALAE